MRPWPFWVKPHSCLILWQHGVFSFTKVCIFLPMLFIRTFITTLCFYDFCNNSVGKKMHTLPRCGLIFPFQMPYFLHWLFSTSSTLLHNWSPLKPQNKLQKKSRALPSSSRRGLRAPDPANPSSEKMTSQPTCFCCAYFAKSVTNLHRLFNMSCINTLFDMFFTN